MHFIITKDTLIHEIISSFPGTKIVFEAYSVNGLIESFYSKRLEFFAKVNQINLSALINDLKGLIKGLIKEEKFLNEKRKKFQLGMETKIASLMELFPESKKVFLKHKIDFFEGSAALFGEKFLSIKKACKLHKINAKIFLNDLQKSLKELK